jgi:hypothetical protein
MGSWNLGGRQHITLPDARATVLLPDHKCAGILNAPIAGEGRHQGDVVGNGELVGEMPTGLIEQ